MIYGSNGKRIGYDGEKDGGSLVWLYFRRVV